MILAYSSFQAILPENSNKTSNLEVELAFNILWNEEGGGWAVKSFTFLFCIQQIMYYCTVLKS